MSIIFCCVSIYFMEKKHHKGIPHRLQNYHKAILSLKKWIDINDGSDMHRDALIQRFEYCTELAWKTIKKMFREHGEDDRMFPKELIRKAEQLWIIQHWAILIDCIDERNILSHNYSEERADESGEFIQEYYHVFFGLYSDLLQHLDTHES